MLGKAGEDRSEEAELPLLCFKWLECRDPERLLLTGSGPADAGLDVPGMPAELDSILVSMFLNVERS